MAGELIYAFRVMRLPLLDAGGSPIGKLDDIVVTPAIKGGHTRVLGFVATSARRRIFVNAARLASLDSDGARLRSWDVDLNPFKPRVGEILIGRDIIDKKVGDETVSDVALRAVGDARSQWWEPAKVRLAKRSALRRRPSYRLVDFDDLPQLFAGVAGAEVAAEVARLRDMHASDVAAAVRQMPLERRKQLAQSMDDDRLADLLEELPEAEQLRIIEGLDLDRLVNVLEEMEFDDLADLLQEMPGEQRTRVLDAMDDEDAETMRRLLSYTEGTAGTCGQDGYNTGYAYHCFRTCSSHPDHVWSGGGYSSSAAGRYQFLTKTWRSLDRDGFGPAEQDRGAMDLVERRGVKIPEGRPMTSTEFVNALKKMSYEWASLPYSPYGQPRRSLAQTRGRYCDLAGC